MKITFRNGTIESLVDQIMEDINSSKLTESSVVSYALEKGYTKSEGQKAWTIIFRELKKMNAKDWPKFYTCDFLEPGLVSYEDVGAGINMLKQESIMKMLPSMKGKPVIINHANVHPGNLNRHAVGYVTNVWWDSAANKAKCEFIISEDEAHEAIQNGYSVSCAYKVTETGKGGEHHAIPYETEIMNGEFEHLALVTNPRYEDCRVMMNDKPARVNAAWERRCPKCKKDVKTVKDGDKNGFWLECAECGEYIEALKDRKNEEPDENYENLERKREGVFVNVRVVKNWKKGDMVLDIDGKKCQVLYEDSEGNYGVKYSDGTRAVFRELDLEKANSRVRNADKNSKFRIVLEKGVYNIYDGNKKVAGGFKWVDQADEYIKSKQPSGKVEGYGLQENSEKKNSETCGRCDGTGKMDVMSEDGGTTKFKKCTKCGGTGKVKKNSTKKNSTIRVRIAAKRQ